MLHGRDREYGPVNDGTSRDGDEHEHSQRDHRHPQRHELNGGSFVSINSEDEDALTMEDAMSIVGFGKFQYRAICVAGLLLTVDAMEMMLLSFLGPSIRCEFGISGEEEALLTTVVFIGATIGAYMCGVLADKFGRRYCLKWLSTLTAVLGLLSAFAPEFWTLLAIRGAMGICLGGSSIGFSYLMEILPTEHRGRWGILIELFWTLGTIFEASIAWIIYSNQQSTGAWRTLLAVSSVPVFIAALCFLCNVVPESPRFLVTRGQMDAAYRILRDAAKSNGNSLPANGFLASVHAEDDNSHGSMGNPLMIWKVLQSLFSPTFRVVTVFLWFMWFTNAFAYYGLVLMTTSLEVNNKHSETEDGLYCNPVTLSPFETNSSSSAFISVFVATIAELPGVLFAAVAIDALGRKPSQSLCFGGTCIALLLMLVLPSSQLSDTMCLFFGRGFIEAAFVIAYVYTPEVYPTTIRTTAFGLSNSMGRVGGMVAPFVGEDLIERGQRTTALTIFVVFTGCAMLVTFLLPVETKGVSLADTTRDVDAHMGKIEPGEDADQRNTDFDSIEIPTRPSVSRGVNRDYLVDEDLTIT